MTKTLAYTVSVLFHPLLIPSYALVTLLAINPFMFGVNNIWGNEIILLQVFLSTFLLPSFSLLMLRQLDFIKSIELEDKKDRIIPFIVTGIFYIGLAVFFVKTPNHSPFLLTVFILGATIGLWVSFIVNLFTKISLHAVAIAGFLAIVIITMQNLEFDHLLINLGSFGVFNMSIRTLLMLVIFLTGLVGTSRLLLRAHAPFQVYAGYFVGFLTQFIASNFLSNY